MSEKELGVRSLDEVMNKLGISNAELVAASTEQLTFKMVQKGRKGRRLTPNMQKKILNALKTARPAENIPDIYPASVT